MKISERACADCGSPARGNPCWYFLDRPEWATSGADPPCSDYEYARDARRHRRLGRRWFWITALALLVLIGIIVAAKAHEWYPTWCCSGGDCGPLAGSRVQLTAQGYLVDGKFVVPLSEARKSMDGRYHGCFPKDDELKCFFAPPPGS